MDDCFKGFLDDSFDPTFNSINLPWLPWVGSRYYESDTKTIILGESVYVYGAGDETTRQRILHRESLRQRQMTHGILGKIKSRYLRNFERAVFLKTRPSGLERAHLWSHVIFHNLVLELLPSRKNRPTMRDYTAGWEAFLELAEVVQPQRCIVYGLESPKIEALQELLASRKMAIQKKRLPAVGRSRPVKLSIQINGRPLDLLFIRHPSAFFPWKKWGAFIREAGFNPLAVETHKIVERATTEPLPEPFTG
ncbi:hypothetical protein [Pseudomonas sp. OF001]|uniref:hypothetical protein n=1 Tax=Pseudomonas sp. OF001 TaxID=2772300 RepID=UPI001918862B|nr:hypothetical protein [Pseudomonas sp. OF001]